MINGAICTPWTEQICEHKTYNEHFCADYACPREIPSSIQKLIEKYPGSAASPLIKAKLLTNVSISANESENSIPISSKFKNSIKSYFDNLKTNISLLFDNKVKKIKSYSNHVYTKQTKFFLSLISNYTTATTKTTTNAADLISELFEKKFKSFSNKLTDHFHEKLTKQEIFFLSLFTNVSQDIGLETLYLKKLKDELPSKSFFNEMHLSLQEIRNKSREKIRFHLTSDSSLIKKIIEKLKASNELEISEKSKLQLSSTTFNLLAGIKQNVKLMESSLQSLNHLRLLNNIYQCQCPCVIN